MNKLDLIIDEIMQARMFIKPKSIADLHTSRALAAARELRALKPVAYMHAQGNYEEPKMYDLSQTDRDRGWTEYPLFALGESND